MYREHTLTKYINVHELCMLPATRRIAKIQLESRLFLLPILVVTLKKKSHMGNKFWKQILQGKKGTVKIHPQIKINDYGPSKICTVKPR